MSSSGPDQGGRLDLGGLASLPGLDDVREQLADVIAVIQAEARRREAGIAVARPAWKNLAFAGGPGSGKSRVAAALGRHYCALGVLTSGHLIEAASTDLVGLTTTETMRLMREAGGSGRGGVLLINDAPVGLLAAGQQPVRCLLQVLADFRKDLVVILAGQAGQLRGLLDASPVLASRFPAIIDFPSYTAAQLAEIFAALAGEAGFIISPAAASRAAVVLGRVNRGRGSARLAVQLLDRATATQARRITATSQPVMAAALGTIDVTDIPGHLDPLDLPMPSDTERPGQYL